MSRRSLPVTLALFALAACIALPAPPAQAQRFSIEDVLSPGYPIGLVAAKAADRIAWIEYEEGRRNVYTATAPSFEPVRLTRFEADDGRDLSTLRISDDGSVVVFLRGHNPNREGWIANPASDPRGVERAAWAVSTAGGEPWRVAEAWNVALSPDGKWIAYTSDGNIYRAPVNPGVVNPGGVVSGGRGRRGPAAAALQRVWKPGQSGVVAGFAQDRLCQQPGRPQLHRHLRHRQAGDHLRRAVRRP